MRRRRQPKALVTDGALLFDFYLAEKLGRTVDELHRTVSQAEWVYWHQYFALQAQQMELERKKAGA